MVTYNLYNQSTVVNNSNLQSMVKAINNFLITLCNDWSLAPIQLVVGTYNSRIPIPNNTIIISDLTDNPGALGYHYEENGNAIGKVFAKTILNYGGAVLYKDQHTFTVAQCLCHELLEMIMNPVVNKWVMDNNAVLWAQELCDPVESNLIVYTLPGNIKVGLSDYVLPNWFSADSTRRPFNKMNTLLNPFSLDTGGYAIILNIESGSINSVFGMAHSHANALSRIKSRINDAHSTGSKMKEIIKAKFK